MNKKEEVIEKLIEFRNIISTDKEIPHYKLLKRIIEIGINHGYWAPGDKIPPERFLSNVFGFSTGTVKHALQELCQEGKVERVHGSGTFISLFSLNVQRRSLLFVNDFNDSATPNTYRFISMENIDCPVELKSYFNAEPGEKLFKLSRTIKESNGVMVFSVDFLRSSRFPSFSALGKNRFEVAPLSDILEDEYGITLTTSTEIYDIISADKEDSFYLSIPVISPLLRVRALRCEQKNNVIDYQENHVCLNGKGLLKKIQYSQFKN